MPSHVNAAVVSVPSKCDSLDAIQKVDGLNELKLFFTLHFLKLGLSKFLNLNLKSLTLKLYS